MTNANKNQDQSNHGPLALSWDTLPELAKSRWEEAVAFDVTIENQLAKAKADRSLAERERQKIAREILEATKEVCEEILNDGKRALEKARDKEAQASRNLGDSKDELEIARAVRVDAEGYREKVIAEAQQEAQDILSRSRAASERECWELKEQSTQEARRILGQAEIMRVSALEELETQQIYTEAARLKADSHEVLTKIREMRNEPFVSREEGPGGDPPAAEATDLQNISGQSEAPMTSEATLEENPQVVDTRVTENGKKSARHPSPS